MIKINSIESINSRRHLIDWDIDFSCESIKLLKLSPGSSVGNHFHLIKDELFILIEGTITELVLDEVITKNVKSPAAWLVKKGVRHTYFCAEQATLICLASKRFDSKDDYK